MSRVIAASAESKLDTAFGASGRAVDYRRAGHPRILLIGMFVLGSRIHGVRHSFWKFLAFVTACIVVLVLVLAFLAG